MALERLTHLDDDGLFLPEVGAWGETKYRLISNYSSMFATAMKDKWDSRVYVDLFAGSGRARVAGTSVIIPTSPSLALAVRHPFDKYVFCEIEHPARTALEQRVQRDFSDRDVSILSGDCNQNVESILSGIPKPSRNRTVLAFCVADPRNTGELKFETIRGLSALYIDFLVLIPSFMDAHRNPRHYTKRDNPRIDDFLGSQNWRAAWEQAKATRRIQFGVFLVEQFGISMRELGYQFDGPGDEESIRDGDNRLLYHLAFFSRHPRGRDFWVKARRSSIDQLRLDFGSDR